MSQSRLLVPVANPETADRLLDTAIEIARDRDLEIHVLHVVTVPMQLSLEHARRSLDTDEGESTVEYAVEQAQAADVPATGRVRFGRDVARSILNVAGSTDAETILLGWRGRPRRRDVILGSYIDEVLANASCDVAVKRIDREGGDVASVLVPVAGGPNTEYAAELAGAVARGNDASVELVTVVSPGAGDDAVADGRDLLTRTSPSLGAVETVTETVLRGDDVVETIVDRSSDHDVTVVGAAEDGLLQRVLVGSIPQAVGRQADGAVIMAKRHQGVSTALRRRVRDVLR